MSLTIITGPTGGGKTFHAIDQCRAQLNAGESVCFITPISTRDHDRRDPALNTLFDLTQTQSTLRLQTPIELDEIELKNTKHVVLDEVMFNPAGMHRFLGAARTDQHLIEFSTLDFFRFAARCIQKKCTLTCVTQELPASINDALEIHSGKVPYSIVNVNRSVNCDERKQVA